VVDFRPAVTDTPVQSYSIKYWGPKGEDGSEAPVNMIDVPLNRTTGNVVPDLTPSTDYSFQVLAKLADGSELSSDVIAIKTPKEGKSDNKLLALIL